MEIGENPREYGFEEPKAEKYPDLEAVEIPSPVKLDDIANVFQLPLSELLRVNPNLQKKITPPHLKSYEVWIPEAKTKAASDFVTQLSELKIARPTTLATQRTTSYSPRHYHVVHSGETLGSIAHQYKVTSSYLRRLNQLGSNHVQAGMKLRITAQKYHPGNFTRYRVKRGDNLNGISRKFGISVEALKAENALKRNRISVGQILRIRTGT